MNNDYEDFSWLDEKKWAPWKVTLGVVAFCEAFWLGAWQLATIIF